MPSRTVTGPTSAAACPAHSTSTPRSTSAKGLRIPPVRIWDQGRYLGDVVRLIISNTRVPDDAEGDLHAQA